MRAPFQAPLGVFLLALLSSPLPSQEKFAKTNGDVDGNGFVDITDAVYLLNNLFLGGNPPVPFAPCTESTVAFPDSGQTKCYEVMPGRGWVEVPCDSATCPGQDGAYHSGCPMEGRFTDGGDGTVSDRCTGLIWLKQTANVIEDDEISEDDRLSWCDALKYCESLSFAGHDDWRLPNVRELQSIVDYGRVNPSIDPIFGALPAWYWSSSTYEGNSQYAWFVGFDFGYVDGGMIAGDDNRGYVRPVRNGP